MMESKGIVNYVFLSLKDLLIKNRKWKRIKNIGGQNQNSG
jgi:hypothetical protein